MTSLEYYIEQVEQFISALTDDIESGDGTVVTQTKLAVYREVLKHLEEIEQSSYNSISAELNGDLISRQAVQDYIAKYLSQYLYNDVREAVEAIDEYVGELQPVNPQNCDNCEVGNPCLYCRHEFEPQERSDKE